jgi:hypothetical protein
MVYIVTIGISRYDRLDTICSQRNSDSSIDYTEASLSTFFISPKLSIDYDEIQNPDISCQMEICLNANI